MFTIGWSLLIRFRHKSPFGSPPAHLTRARLLSTGEFSPKSSDCATVDQTRSHPFCNPYTRQGLSSKVAFRGRSWEASMCANSLRHRFHLTILVISFAVFWGYGGSVGYATDAPAPVLSDNHIRAYR